MRKVNMVLSEQDLRDLVAATTGWALTHDSWLRRGSQQWNRMADLEERLIIGLQFLESGADTIGAAYD